jgi:N-acetylglutamate synthase-like GNAT family acetyltransferase
MNSNRSTPSIPIKKTHYDIRHENERTNPMTTETRELKPEEFPLAEKLWEQYRGQKANAPHERIFGVFDGGSLAATARYTRHPDGAEMDCVFSSEKYRGKGYARMAVEALLQACGLEPIFIHSTLVLIAFYKTLGWVPIPEEELPQSIRERFIFCFGEMQGCNVCPMKREPDVSGS